MITDVSIITSQDAIDAIDREASVLQQEAAFLRANSPLHQEDRWPMEKLLGLLHFYHCMQAIGVVWQDCELVGLGLARPAASWDRERIDEAYNFDFSGDTLWIELVCASKPGVTRELWKLMVQRFGRKMWVGFRRARRKGRLVLKPFSYMERKLKK